MVDVREVGGKRYEVRILLDPDEMDRISVAALRAAGARLKFPDFGGLRAVFWVNVADPEDAARFVRLLTVFGQDGEYDQGLHIGPHFFGVLPEDAGAREAVVAELTRWQECWQARWQAQVEQALQKTCSRIETLRMVRDVAGAAISETEVEQYLRELLRERHQSELFVATCLWRMGWPDGRQAVTLQMPSSVVPATACGA